MKKAIHTNQAGAVAGPYSQAIIDHGCVYLSGQIAPEAGDVPAQTKQALAQVKAILEAAGSHLSQVVKVTVYMTDLNQFAAMNAVYATVFNEPYPARSTVQVAALPKGALVEIECLAVYE